MANKYLSNLIGTKLAEWRIKFAKLDCSGLTALRTITLQDVSHTLVGRDTTDTLTNKRIKKRVYSTANTATLTPEIDTYDVFALTGLTGGVTIANHSTSTPDDGDMILIRYKDNGTARSISHGTNYVSRGATMLTTTVVNKWSRELFEWNANTSKYECIATATEA